MPTSVNSTATAPGAYVEYNKCAKNRAACHNAKLPSGTNTSGGSAVPAHLLVRYCWTNVKRMHGERKAINQWQNFDGFVRQTTRYRYQPRKGKLFGINSIFADRLLDIRGTFAALFSSDNSILFQLRETKYGN
jgi:hypothetical protein